MVQSRHMREVRQGQINQGQSLMVNWEHTGDASKWSRSSWEPLDWRIEDLTDLFHKVEWHWRGYTEWLGACGAPEANTPGTLGSSATKGLPRSSSIGNRGNTKGHTKGWSLRSTDRRRWGVGGDLLNAGMTGEVAGQRVGGARKVIVRPLRGLER